MKKHIAEDLPARKYAPAAAAGGGRPGNEKGGKEAKSPEARVRQAVYDIRYRARREEITLEQAYSQYMQNSNMSQPEKTLVKQKLFGKGGMKAEEFNIEDFATDNVANALYKVFVEGVKNEEPLVLTYMEKLETAEHQVYTILVRDKNGRQYTRYADRDKMNQLRSNPNIERVEMLKVGKEGKTAYGEPYEGERSRGEQTAAALGGGQKAKKDYDGDGKLESSAKEHAGAVHNAIQRKRGGKPDGQDTSNVKEELIGHQSRIDANHNNKIDSQDFKLLRKRKKKSVDEEFLGEVSDEELTANFNQPPIDVMKGKNKVVIAPEIPGSEKNALPSVQMAHYEKQGSVLVEKKNGNALSRFSQLVMEKAESEKQQQLFGLALSVKRGETSRSQVSAEVLKIVDSMSEKKIRDFAKTKHEGLPVRKEEKECDCDEGPKMDSGSPCEDDSRGMKTKINLAKNKLRAMGLKCSYEPTGEVIDEAGTGTFNHPIQGGQTSYQKPVLPGEKRLTPDLQKPNLNTPGGSKLLPQAKSKSSSVQVAHYEPEGEQLDEFLGAALKLAPKVLPAAAGAAAIYQGIRAISSGKKQGEKGGATVKAQPSPTIQGATEAITRHNRALQQVDQMNSYELNGSTISEEESDTEGDKARERGDWRTRSERPVRRRPSVSDNPRYGSMSDAEWERSSHNPANRPRPRRRYR